jgi:predicted nucleic acid-binding protein
MTVSPIFTIQPKNKYLLDTTVFVDYWRRSLTAKGIINSFLQNRSISGGFSILTEAELWCGIKDLQSERDHRIMLRPFSRYSINVLIAHQGGKIKAQFKILSLNDAIIAATANYYRLTLITRNANHFKPLTGIISVIEYDF